MSCIPTPNYNDVNFIDTFEDIPYEFRTNVKIMDYYESDQEDNVKNDPDYTPYTRPVVNEMTANQMTVNEMENNEEEDDDFSDIPYEFRPDIKLAYCYESDQEDDEKKDPTYDPNEFKKRFSTKKFCKKMNGNTPSLKIIKNDVHKIIRKLINASKTENKNVTLTRKSSSSELNM